MTGIAKFGLILLALPLAVGCGSSGGTKVSGPQFAFTLASGTVTEFPASRRRRWR
ncbi:MAG TPA: hypothetical protein VK819_12125 [Acidobacteriaceae bacterium]|nr:hypothetical protein [Acidobacteriaceae bacterium]